MTHLKAQLQKAAKSHPYFLFAACTYLWSWPFWWMAVLFDHVPGMKQALVLLGVFGPGLSGVLLLRLREQDSHSLLPALPFAARVKAFCLGAGLAALALAAFRFDFMGVMALVPDVGLEITAETPIYVYGLFAVVISLSGFLFVQTQSRRPSLRAFFAGLVPDWRVALKAVGVLSFLPCLLLLSNLISDAAGIYYEAPLYRTMPVGEWLPLMLVKIFTVAMLTGGNEEYGWRGVLLPILQRNRSPLMATILIALVWEPWHLPLTLDISGQEKHFALILVARVVAILPIALLLTMLYNLSRGSIFLCILLHACFNSQIKLFAGSELMALGLMLAVVSGVVGFKMWRGNRGYSPPVPS